MADSTSHLVDHARPSRVLDNDINDEQYGEQITLHPSEQAISKKLKISTFIFSAFTFGCIIASFILIKRAPSGTNGWSHWNSQQSTRRLGKWILASLILSFINLLLPLYAVFNLVINIVLASGIIAKLVPFFEALPNGSWCYRFGYPPQYPVPAPLPVEPECEEKKKVVKIMMITTGVLASIVAAIYIARLVFRSIVIIRSKFWTRSSWAIPTGNYTFQISLNVIRRDAEAGTTSSHGPVHL